MGIENYYSETASVITVTKPTDFSTALGSESSVAFRCAINPVSGYESFAGGRNDVFADYKVFCSSTVALTEGKRVKWSSQYFNVVFVKDTFNMGHHKLVFLQKDVR
jgi:head-tail adaptor